MLKRKAIASIKNWVNTKNKKCLVVQGARQTGKTYIIERFAEDNYEELLEINFKQMVSAVDIFSGDLTVDNMVMAMRFRFPEKKILPGKTLIFLDEIQECQEAITSLKFWAIDNTGRETVSGFCRWQFCQRRYHHERCFRRWCRGRTGSGCWCGLRSR